MSTDINSMNVLYSKGKNDENYTLPYAVKPLIKYINKDNIVWCPFDKEDSEFVKLIEQNGNKVIKSHIAVCLINECDLKILMERMEVIMSHFTVGIITKKEPTSSDIEDILAPFDENKEVRHIITKQELIDKRRKSIKDFANSTTYKSYINDPESYIKKHGSNEAHIKYISEEFPKQLKWTDEECYQSEIKYYDEDEILPSGDVVSNYNPDSKWDWYEIGGRWDGLIINAVTGEECNSAKVSDIKNIFDDDAYKKAIRFWELYIEGQEPQSDVEKEMLKNLFYNEEYYTKYFGSKKDYAKCQASFTTYALIDEYGLWHEKGKMGWWGISDQTEDAEVKWLKKYEEYLKDAREKGYYLTIVDCHI